MELRGGVSTAVPVGREIAVIWCRRECDVAFDSEHTVAAFRVEGLGSVVVSHQSNLPGAGPECLAFRCDERGEVVDWDELAWNGIADAEEAVAACLTDAIAVMAGEVAR